MLPMHFKCTLLECTCCVGANARTMSACGDSWGPPNTLTYSRSWALNFALTESDLATANPSGGLHTKVQVHSQVCRLKTLLKTPLKTLSIKAFEWNSLGSMIQAYDLKHMTRTILLEAHGLEAYAFESYGTMWTRSVWLECEAMNEEQKTHCKSESHLMNDLMKFEQLRIA